MTKIAAIIGGVLLMAGVAMAGTVSSLGSSNDRTIGSTLPVASATTTVRQDDRGREAELRGRANEPGEDVRRDRGREAELRGRANEPGEDVRREDRRADLRVRIADDHGHHQRGHDDGGHRGHGGHGGDD